MKRDRLYTAGKNIKPNLFLNGGTVLAEAQAYKSANPWDFVDDKSLIDQYVQTDAFKQGKGGWFNMTRESNPFSRTNAGNTLSSIGNVANPMLTGLISHGYSTGGIGEGIGAVGGAVGDIVGKINPIAGGIVKIGTGILGGLTNRAFGTKENKENIAALHSNNALARSAGNNLINSYTSSDLIDSSGQMTSSLGFGTKDLVKGGWFSKGKAQRKGQKILNQESAALAYQNHGLTTGAEKVDNIMDTNAQRNFIYALGGPMGYIPTDMPIVDYNFMNDYLTTKKKQIESKESPINTSVLAANAFCGGGKMFGMGGCKCNKFGEGGIEIKHPGRLTALKERTGKTEAELWAEGKPEVRKMITFARNARKWKKAYGGYLDATNNLFALGGEDDGVLDWSPVDTRSDTTTQGYHEGDVMFGAAYLPSSQGPLGILDTIDKATNVTRPDSPLYNPNVANIGVAPTPVKAKNALEALQMVNAMKAEKAAKAAAAWKPTAMQRSLGIKTKEEADRFARLITRDIDSRSKANTVAKAAKKKADAAAHKSAVEAYEASGRKAGTINKGNRPGKYYNRRAITVDDVFKAYGGPLDETLFALGGDIQNHGADWTTGMSHIDEGGSHEENPNQGVQVGVDPEGTPNLVEEGETIFNDYVYSNRIELDDEAKEAFHIGKKKKTTYADLSKRLEKEASERPNDPISQAALKAQLQDLADHQERQKQELEAERAREAFEALSPEEQTNLMQYAQQQQAAEQEAAMQEQAMAAQQAAPQETVSPEEQMMQEQMMAQQGGMPEGYAEGGKINKFAPGGQKNAGTWKEGDSSSNWNTYTRGGLRDYLQNIINRINAAPDENTRNTIRQEAIDTVSRIQQAYRGAYQNRLTPSNESAAVRTLQELFQKEGGNAYFGNIADNINLPLGADTGDRADKGWVDGYWGPRTSIRNWGSTEYGDSGYYQDIADLATQAGLTYAPITDWTYGDSENPYQLYGLSMLDAVNAGNSGEYPQGYWGPGTENNKSFWEAADETGYTGKPAEDWQGNPTGENPNAPIYVSADGTKITPTEAKVEAAKPVNKPVQKSEDKVEWNVTPNYRNDKLRYAGLLGPAVGLGLQLAGVGRPKTKDIDAVLEAYDRTGSAMADYRPIGNYLRYTPMDIWAEQNRLNANARATDRAIANSGATQGSRMAGLLANEYNNQIGSGQLYRQALEYNDNLNKQVQDFNRGTDMFNAQSYNQVAMHNAETRNRDRQLRANLGMQAAMQKADMDAGWYNGIYGNIAGLFKGIGDLGRENAQHNMIAEMAADGIFGTMSPQTNTGRRGKYLTFTKRCKGGKLNRKKGGK